jgi:hypothetical protein
VIWGVRPKQELRKSYGTVRVVAELKRKKFWFDCLGYVIRIGQTRGGGGGLVGKKFGWAQKIKTEIIFYDLFQ